MTANSNFFKSKKPWSKFKDDLLAWYLVPYISKLLSTGKPLYIIDCFAGKGIFDDKIPGSPIIIANNIQCILEKDHNKNLYGIFIEKTHHKDLKNNLKNYENCTVWKGRFEEHIDEIASIAAKSNIFIYIDPYGIKSLSFKYIEKIYTEAIKNKNSIEVFINFNSFGFIRQACNVLSYVTDDFQSIDDDFIEESLSKEQLDRVFNGDSWVKFLNLYKEKKYSAHQLEEAIVKEYQATYNKLFKYYLNIPIKTKEKNIPKYRMIFFSNHVDGILLMNKKMHDTLIKMKEKELDGQMSMFDMPVGCTFEYTSNLKPLDYYIDKSLKQNQPINLKYLVCDIMRYTNIRYTKNDIISILKKMQSINKITVEMESKKTNIKVNTSSWDTKNYDIYIMKK